MRYTSQGGGPCDGALNGAVIPVPLSSGSAGHPVSAHAFAMRATVPASVTRVASPSTTTSASRIDTAIEQRGSRPTLRLFRVPAPVWNQNAVHPQSTDRSHMRASVLVDGHEPCRASVVRRSRRRARIELLDDFGPVHRREAVRGPQVDDVHCASPFVVRRRATTCRSSDVQVSAESSCARCPRGSRRTRRRRPRGRAGRRCRPCGRRDPGAPS